MEESNKTARQLFEEVQSRPPRPRFGFGQKAALVNVDLQKVFTLISEFPETSEDIQFEPAEAHAAGVDARVVRVVVLGGIIEWWAESFGVLLRARSLASNRRASSLRSAVGETMRLWIAPAAWLPETAAPTDYDWALIEYGRDF